MKNELILHAGPHKTGSTSIQEFYRKNIELFADKGFEFTREMKFREPWVTDSPTDFLTTWQPAMDELQKGTKSLVISDETFAEILQKKPEAITDIKKHFPDVKIKIIVYLRRQDLHYESFYKTLVYGYSHTAAPNISHIIDSPGYTYIPDSNSRFDADPLILHDYDYYAWLTKLIEVAGKENVVARIFDRKAFVNGSLYHDFVDALGIEWDENFIVPKRISAKGLYSKAVPVCRKGNSFFETDMEKRIFGSFINHAGEILDLDEDKTVLSPTERKEILEKFAQSNTQLMTTFFDSHPHFASSEKEFTQQEENRVFSKEELEEVLLCMHSLWYELVSKADYQFINFIRLTRAQKDLARGVRGARLRKFIYKTIHSIGKRLCKNWISDTGEMKIALANADSYIDHEAMKRKVKEAL